MKCCDEHLCTHVSDSLRLITRNGFTGLQECDFINFNKLCLVALKVAILLKLPPIT